MLLDLVGVLTFIVIAAAAVVLGDWRLLITACAGGIAAARALGLRSQLDYVRAMLKLRPPLR